MSHIVTSRTRTLYTFFCPLIVQVDRRRLTLATSTTVALVEWMTTKMAVPPLVSRDSSLSGVTLTAVSARYYEMQLGLFGCFLSLFPCPIFLAISSLLLPSDLPPPLSVLPLPVLLPRSASLLFLSLPPCLTFLLSFPPPYLPFHLHFLIPFLGFF